MAVEKNPSAGFASKASPSMPTHLAAKAAVPALAFWVHSLPATYPVPSTSRGACLQTRHGHLSTLIILNLACAVEEVVIGDGQWIGRRVVSASRTRNDVV